MKNQFKLELELSFSGNDTNEGIIDFYDISQALIGFQRSLALTTHLVLNGEVITQAPSLKGARIYASIPEEGSWKIPAYIVAGAAGVYGLGTAPNDSPIGHLVFSMYDYAVSHSLGVHVDYDKSLGQLYEEANAKNLKIKPVTESQADSLIEKCSTAFREMHRPIYKTETASLASITGYTNQVPIPLHAQLSLETYQFISETYDSPGVEKIDGRISSYNSNTYKGRIFVPTIGRPIAFEINPPARNTETARIITTSLHLNATRQGREVGAVISMLVIRRTSKTGQLKSFMATRISKAE